MTSMQVKRFWLHV